MLRLQVLPGGLEPTNVVLQVRHGALDDGRLGGQGGIQGGVGLIWSVFKF